MKLPKISEEVILALADSHIIFERGEDYFESGYVEEIDFADNLLTAKVLGSLGKYNVKIYWDNNHFVQASCNCPYDGYICKHIVAVLLSLNKDAPKVVKEIKIKEEKQKNMEDLLSGLSKKKLLEMIADTARLIPEASSHILKLADKFGLSEDRKKASDLALEQATLYLTEIEHIVSEFDQYGGGPDEDEYKCYDFMGDLEKTLTDKSVPGEVREEIISFSCKYIQSGNSGFNDSLLDLAFTAANEEAHWRQLIKGLKPLVEAKGRGYYQDIILSIYRDELGDEETYLKGRKNALYYGADYLDLAKFWKKKRKLSKAIEIAEEGLKKAEGRLSDLKDFLRIEYDKSGKNELALEMKIQLWEESPILEGYKEIKNSVPKKQWPTIEKRLLKTIYNDRSVNSQIIEIRLLRKDYGSVLKHFQLRADSWHSGRWDSPNEKWAKILFAIFPQEIVEIYKKLVYRAIEGKKRNAYKIGAGFARLLKKFWLQLPDGNKNWKRFISNIRLTHPRQPALLDEFSRL